MVDAGTCRRSSESLSTVYWHGYNCKFFVCFVFCFVFDKFLSIFDLFQIMNDYPSAKFALIGILAFFVLVNREKT